MAQALPVVIALASAAASTWNGIQTAKKQDRAAAQGIRQQAENQRQINARLNQTISQAQKSTPDEERAKAQADYLAQIHRNINQAKTGLTARGINSQFDTQAADEGNQVSDYGANIADLFSRMDAPILQRQNEGNSYGNLGMDLSVLGGNAAQDAFLTDLKLKSIRRNPWIDLASSFGNSYASNYSPSTSPSSVGGGWGSPSMYGGGGTGGVGVPGLGPGGP